MNRLLPTVVLALAFCAPAHALDIGEALWLEELRELDACAEAQGVEAEAKIIAGALERVRQAAGLATLPPLRLATCGEAARVAGGVLVVHPTLAHLPLGERLFVLAHEVGHIVNEDFGWLMQTYASIVPLRASANEAMPVLMRHGDRITEVRHAMEYEADRFARVVLTRLGRNGAEDGIAYLRRLPPSGGNIRHPPTSARIGALAR